MKKIFVITVLVSFLTASGIMAQVSLNFESGNQAIEIGNCWKFEKVTYTNVSGNPISGSWSSLSDQLNQPSAENCWIKTPWMLVGSGNITFQAKFTGSNGNTRETKLFYIPYNASNAPSFEGTPVEFYSYTWPQPYALTPQAVSVPVPGIIANSAVVYKIRVSRTGNGGSTRMISDDFIFPGLYMSNPAGNCIPQVVLQDADGDGVSNTEDAYPTDPYRAYNSYFPSETQSATLAFEDLWPAKGDYDFNDVVVDYRLQTVSNAAGNVVEVFAGFILRASGASFHNGFGFQLDGITPDKIISVTGNDISNSPANEHINYSIAANGLENGQTYATCIVADCFRRVINKGADPSTPSMKYINTDPSEAKVPYYPMNVHLVFINNGIPAPGGTVSLAQLTSNAFNFFIVAETWTGAMNGEAKVTIQDRGKEIHLADRIPTDKVNASLFGTLDDDSNPATGKYYKTENNLPWGISILQGFEYPIEKAPIDEAYYHFVDWAGSAGVLYPEWFSNSGGNRNAALIYIY